MCKSTEQKFLVSEEKLKEAEFHMEKVLSFMGHDTKREGMAETPKRYVKFLHQFCNPAPFEFKTFENDGSSDEMVIVKNIPFYSMCEHHLAPFFGTASIAYIPDKRIVGLSKIPRALDLIANQPQNQERITKHVADLLEKELNPKGVAVVLSAQHLCVAMRGVKKHDTVTVTSCMKGVFMRDFNARNEFLNLSKS